ncbi:hypothetical protein DID78_00820 [Candidatus Marinamargulisbacteria bacterium SCGC AG-343-D04]|nr:hypothetical protein DID78_00820 [Candidatus Marinamargulisbacteria bacterium SCGC AG-343-D04]
MVAHFSSLLVVSLESVLCFLFSLFFVPLNRPYVSYDVRLFLGVFSSISYLLTNLILSQSLIESYFSVFSLFLGLLFFITFFSLYLSLYFKSSRYHVDYAFMFSLWYSGIFALLVGFHLYSYLILSVCFLIIVYCTTAGLKYFHLNSVHKTLIFSCDHYKTVDSVKEMLELFDSKVLAFSVSKSSQYQVRCEYRIPSVANHVLSKHLFDRSDISEMTLND